MKTEQIALVLAIVREGSISKAAESLFISQPTASNMLKALVHTAQSAEKP